MRILQPLSRSGIYYRWTTAAVAAVTAACCMCGPVFASASIAINKADESVESIDAAAIFADRKSLYDQVATVTQIPWYRLAAIDQYERTLTGSIPRIASIQSGQSASSSLPQDGPVP